MNKNENVPATPRETLAKKLGRALEKLSESYTREGDTAETIKLRDEANKANQAAQKSLHPNSKP